MKGCIWLTGDVHHMSMNGTDHLLLNQREIKTTEVTLCEPYLKLSNHYGFEPTLFFTGKAVEEEHHEIKKLLYKYKFNIGGHTYSAYQPILLSKISRKIVDSPYFTRKYQYNDIKKTSGIIEKKLGITIKDWRNHAYLADKNTNQLLIQLGFNRVSNEVNQQKYRIEKCGENFYSFPINTLPDHEILPHSTEHKGGINPDKWVDMNIDYIRKINEKGGFATLLLHPLCMFLENEFYFMKKMLSTISNLN